jgi:hypothetical protein
MTKRQKKKKKETPADVLRYIVVGWEMNELNVPVDVDLIRRAKQALETGGE